MTYLPDHAAGRNLPHHCEEGFPELLEKIVKESGWDLRNYKKASLKRRIGVRLNTHNISSYKDYHSVLESDPAEYNSLISTITIKVSEFFRDPEVFDLLKELIGRDAPSGHLYRAWSCGCAHGEEAYSLAILLADSFGTGNMDKIRVFATDADEKALDKARKGIYGEESLRNIGWNIKDMGLLQNSFSPPLTGGGEGVGELSSASKWGFHPHPDPPPSRGRGCFWYFEKSEKGYKLNQEIRNMVRFGALDIIRNNPISKVDLLLCRNLLIYFEKNLQEAVMKKLDFALKPGGILVLGTAEALPPSFSSRYTEIRQRSRVYRKLR